MSDLTTKLPTAFGGGASKSHKSRKTDDEPGKPRQRNSSPDDAQVVPTTEDVSIVGSSPVESPSSLVPATTTSVAPATQADGVVSPQANPAPAPLSRELQPWYRPPDSKARKLAEKIAVCRAAGMKSPAIAKKLKTTSGNVKFTEYIARKNGWYDENDQPIDLEVEMALSVDRKLVRNIDAALDGQMTNWQTHEMTLELMKRRKVVNDVDRGMDMAAGMQVVAIRIDMPTIGVSDQKVDELSVGGVPAYLDGEVADGESGLRQTGPAAHEAPPGTV